jgi:ABC-type sugar transport system substrate-binding protein
MTGRTVLIRRKSLLTCAAVAAAALTLGGALSGCGTAGATETGVSTDTSIEMITGAQDSSFYLSMECGAAVQARKLGINLTVAGPAHDTAADQLPLVDGVIVGNPDALIISPASSKSPAQAGTGGDAGRSLSQALYVAQENDTKVIFADTSVPDINVGGSRITSDNAAGGRIAADRLGQMTGGKGSVAVITAPDGGPPAAARIAAFQREMASRYPGVRVLPVQSDAADSMARAARLVSADISAHRNLAAVLGMTRNTTQGAINALHRAHRTSAIKLATFDASPFQMTGLTTGTIQLTVAQEPAVEGADAVNQAVNAIAGKKVTARVATPMIAITRQNMNDPGIRPYIYDGTCASSLRGYMTSGD